MFPRRDTVTTIPRQPHGVPTTLLCDSCFGHTPFSPCRAQNSPAERTGVRWTPFATRATARDLTADLPHEPRSAIRIACLHRPIRSHAYGRKYSLGAAPQGLKARLLERCTKQVPDQQADLGLRNGDGDVISLRGNFPQAALTDRAKQLTALLPPPVAVSDRRRQNGR